MWLHYYCNMPPGLPTPQEHVDGEVAFFSLDTDVIQAAGYNFGKGALNQLPRQLPTAMKLQLTEVVLQEIVGHKLAPVKEAADKFQASTAGLTKASKLLEIDQSKLSRITRGHFRGESEASCSNWWES